jgi:hypothetical protein
MQVSRLAEKVKWSNCFSLRILDRVRAWRTTSMKKISITLNLQTSKSQYQDF